MLMDVMPRRLVEEEFLRIGPVMDWEIFGRGLGLGVDDSLFFSMMRLEVEPSAMLRGVELDEVSLISSLEGLGS